MEQIVEKDWSCHTILGTWSHACVNCDCLWVFTSPCSISPFTSRIFALAESVNSVYNVNNNNNNVNKLTNANLVV